MHPHGDQMTRGFGLRIGQIKVLAQGETETALQGRFRLTLRQDLDLTYPQAETPRHLITMGMHADLGQAVEIALRRMIVEVSAQIGISKAEAYMLCSLAADLRITQTVNREKGVHMMIDKALLVPAAPR
jgi:acetamidase/formamidase